MPWSVFFHRGYAMHGTTEVRNLGRPASHGCVRLLPENAAMLFALVLAEGKKNTRVVVMNGPLAPEPLPTPLPLPRPLIAPGEMLMSDAGRPDELPPPPSAAPSVELAAKTPIETNARAHPETRALTAKPESAREEAPQHKQQVAVKIEPPPMPEPRDTVDAPQARKTPAARYLDKETERRRPKPFRAIVRNDEGSIAVGDEVSVLRSREAWLRSLDRKYGITH
jgi:hypothetical protein